MSAGAGNNGNGRARSGKGVFCLETTWWGRLDNPSSVRPLLELLSHGRSPRIPFIHRGIETRGEFDHCLGKWLQKGYASYPILYLACHGTPGQLHFGDGRCTENTVALEEVGEFMEGRAKGRIIHFGGCGTVNVHGNSLNSFLKRTGAVAVCGYREDVDWLESAAFECLLFSAMQNNAFTKAGAEAMQRRIQDQAGPLAERLGFRMVCKGGA